MEYEQYRQAIAAASQPDYAVFQRRIASDTSYPIAGVRMPVLRKLAKQAATRDWRSLLSCVRYENYEQVMFSGLVIAYAPEELSVKIPVLRQFLPLLDSWALTDSIVPTLKFHLHERPLLWNFAQECLADSHTYTVRFGIVMLLRFFLTGDDTVRTAATLTQLHDDRYYVNMALAWCFAEMAVHDYGLVENILKNHTLDRFVHNKTIQKMRESFRFTKEQKAALVLLRRK